MVESIVYPPLRYTFLDSLVGCFEFKFEHVSAATSVVKYCLPVRFMKVVCMILSTNSSTIEFYTLGLQYLDLPFKKS